MMTLLSSLSTWFDGLRSILVVFAGETSLILSFQCSVAEKGGMVFEISDSGDLLRGAIRDAKGQSEPIHLIVQLDNFVSTVEIDYHEGERYPVLERVEGTPAILDDVINPLVSLQPAQPKATAENH
jgi:hypothetical protein